MSNPVFNSLKKLTTSKLPMLALSTIRHLELVVGGWYRLEDFFQPLAGELEGCIRLLDRVSLVENPAC
jgi:hypothetical protein